MKQTKKYKKLWVDEADFIRDCVMTAAIIGLIIWAIVS